MIILDFGSGNTCKNSKTTVKCMIDALANVDTGNNRIVIKWQLFKSAPPNVPLKHSIFNYAYKYAKSKGYETTASVFDLESLKELEKYNVTFVKLACNSKLYYLRGITTEPVIVSYPNSDAIWADEPDEYMCCVPEYPATNEEYIKRFANSELKHGISDHTAGWWLYKNFEPEIYEKHYVLEYDDANPDAGPFACTPETLREIL
jgi:sialic acid synthase SpsE